MKEFIHRNGGLLVIAALLLAALLAILSALAGVNPVTGAVQLVTAPVRGAATAVSGWVGDQYDRLFRYDQLLEDYRALEEELAEMEEQAREGEAALQENERLRDLLGLARQRPEFTFADASVTLRSTTNWGSQLTIDAGSAAQVSPGDCVVDQYGNLVGVVEEVGATWSVVSTLIDPSIELGVRVSRTDDAAMAEGDFALMAQGQLKLAYLSQEAQARQGDQVVTSGLGDQYPAGLLVGRLGELGVEEDGVSRYAPITPAADLAGVRYVYVITDFTP